MYGTAHSAGFDELVVVELLQILFEHRDLFGDDRQQRLEGPALFRVPQAIDRREQLDQFPRVEAHEITFSSSKLRASSVSSSAALSPAGRSAYRRPFTRPPPVVRSTSSTSTITTPGTL